MDGRTAVEVLAVLVALLLTCVKGEIRCYCNVAPCVSTGYMCKSALSCFSDVQSGVHGCLDHRRRSCSRPGMRCCEEDMCNYMHATGPSEEEGDPEDEQQTSPVESSRTREVWFRAAVIAVPIAGACVLAVLAAAAARMLRQDALRQKRIREQLRRGCSLGDALLPPKDCTVI